MDLKEAKQQWEEKTLQPLIRKYPERRDQFQTPSGILSQAADGIQNRISDRSWLSR